MRMGMGRPGGLGIRACRIGGRGGIIEGGRERVVVISLVEVAFRSCHGPFGCAQGRRDNREGRSRISVIGDQ